MTDLPRILVLCSANRCRSPMAGALLARSLGAAGKGAVVASAGFGPADEPPLRDAVTVCADAGLDIAAHRSRRLTAGLLADADLVLGMTRQHVIDAAVLEPAAWPRTFTLVEVVRRAEQASAGPTMPFIRWVSLVHGLRSRQEVMGYDRSYDVADPVGKPIREFEATFDRIGGLVRSLVELLPSPTATA